VIGVTDAISETVARALFARFGIARERIAVCVTHTHAGPLIEDEVPNMFAHEFSVEEQVRIKAYAAMLVGKLVQVATAALADRRPARIGWAEGTVGFATNRRVIANGKWVGFGAVPQGSHDHALPLLRITDEAGVLRAVCLNYACHCTTLMGKHNFVHPDWAGIAAERIETANPGAVALVTIGCAADANPFPRGALEYAEAHGKVVADEVARLLAAPLRPLGRVTSARFSRIELPLDHTVTKSELQARRANATQEHTRYVASKMLVQLDRGELPTAIPFTVQAWSFAGGLDMVFLSGEVVADYALRLKRERNGDALWVTAYGNSVPCYVPSARMFNEGGYEVDGALDYFGLPTRLARDVEERVVQAVQAILPTSRPLDDRSQS
jgi:hypothetical protein